MSAKKPLRNGKPALMTGEQPSNELRTPSKQLQKLLASVYDQFQHLDNRAANAQVRQDFIFHMTDWLGELHQLKAVYGHPEQLDPRAASQHIASFLYHVTPHLMEAARLLLDYEPGYIFDSPKAQTTKQPPVKPARRSRSRAPSP
jgi:hypothetical protein